MVKKSRKANKYLEKNFFYKRHTRKNRNKGGSLSPLQKSYPGAFPSLGPQPGGFNFLNPMIGSGKKHNKNCKCNKCSIHPSTCKCNKCHKCHRTKKCSCHAAKHHPKNCKCKRCSHVQKGGLSLPYPNGLLGNPWTPNVSTWRQNNIAMDNNHLASNNYRTDVSRAMIDVGANPPFTYLKGGKRSKTLKKNKKGGSNFLAQDLINLGRQASYGVNSIYNGLRGYAAPVNPLPWKDQFQHQS